MTDIHPRPPIRLGIVGVGKIARDQHLPAIAVSDAFALCAAANHGAGVDGVPSFGDISAMLADGPPIDAVAICTPPAGRSDIVRTAIAAGKHVMIEKPPGTTVSEVVALERVAADAKISLFAAWHSREAASVDAARAWLCDRDVRSIEIVWREDIRRWHPGQEWILEAGGFGVFDPAINALSIVTAILPTTLTIAGGSLSVPAGRAAPIAAELGLRCGNGAGGRMELNFLQTGTQTWDIAVETDAGRLLLQDGGKILTIDGVAPPPADGMGEYPRLYRRFARLIAEKAGEVDVRPLQLVADAFLLAKQTPAPAFSFAAPAG